MIVRLQACDWSAKPKPMEKPTTLQRFTGLLKGNVRSVMTDSRRATETGAKSLILESLAMQTGGKAAYDRAKRFSPERVNSVFDELRRNFAGVDLSKIDIKDPDRSKVAGIKRLLTQTNLETFCTRLEAEHILERDGWKRKRIDQTTGASEWTTEQAPGYVIKIDDETFTLLNGRTVEVDRKPIDSLLDLLTEKKQSGEIPGSITNSGAMI